MLHFCYLLDDVGLPACCCFVLLPCAPCHCSPNAAQLYAVYGNNLNRIDAGTGDVTSSLQLWSGQPSAAFGRKITLSADSR